MKKIVLFVMVLLIPVLIFSVNSKIDSLHKELRKTVATTERIDLLIELSVEYVEIDTAKSLEFSNMALVLSDKLGKHKAQAIGNSGYIYYIIGDYEISLRLLLKALIQLDLENNLNVRADILKNIGFVYEELKKYDRSLEYFNKALNIYLELKLKSDVSEVYYSIGSIYNLQNKSEMALEYFHKSFLIDKELNNKNGMATLCYVIGSEHELLSEYVKALESYFDCLKLYEELADQEGIGDSYNVIGNIFQTMGDFDIALEYYKKNLEIQKQLNNKYGISVAYNNIGIIHDDKEEYDKALEYYFRSLEIDEELNDTRGIAYITNNLGIVYNELKEYKKSLKYYQQSLSLSKELNDVRSIANTSNNIAELYLDLNQYAKSFVYVNKGIEFAESIQAKDVILESFYIYSELYSKKQNYKKAFNYFKKYTNLKDSLFTTSIMRVAEIQRNNETEKKEKENELLRKDNKIKDLQIETQKNQRTSMFIIILLVFFFFLFIYLRYQEKKKENHLIIENSKLITSQKEQLDQALGKLKEMNINLERKIKEIKVSRERLQLLNKIIRHDLSNDFVVIKSATNIFLKTSDATVFDEIRKRVDRSLKTIADYREYESFIDSNANLNEFEITELINRIIIDYPNIKFDIKGKCKVFADDALDSVFTNLIFNSIAHGNSTQIDIIISSEKDMCKIKFIDDGKGIPDEIKDKIFDEGFFSGKAGNTGIGLHIVKKTIERYGGFISLEDNETGGAVFVIKLRSGLTR